MFNELKHEEMMCIDGGWYNGDFNATPPPMTPAQAHSALRTYVMIIGIGTGNPYILAAGAMMGLK